MSYMMEICEAGRTVEVYKYYTAGHPPKGKKRAPKMAITPEDVKKVNERNAAKKLRLILAENFGAGDVHTVIGYSRREAPSPKEARRHLEQFMRKLRQYCKDHVITLRYITVTEYKRKRIHHHLVIPGIPAEDIAKLWGQGRPHITPLDSSGQYAQLADYLIKETSKTFTEPGAPYGKRWNQSKNLRPPKITKTVVRANAWRKDPKPRKGYYVEKDSIRDGTHEVTGYDFQFYRMVMLEQPQKRREAS